MSEQRSGMLLASYQLRLPSFEGPLDVLLGLIEREQLEISDLSLVAVTGGFLDHIATLDDAPPALLADFLGIAARLLVLKSRAMLPQMEDAEEDEEVDDLAGQLREYQRMRRVAGGLEESQASLWRSFARVAPPPERPTRVNFVLPPVATLGKALLRALARQPNEPESVVIRRVVSVTEMAARLYSSVIQSKRGRRFMELVDRRDRDEVVAGFIALLALWRRRQVDLTQDGLFADIYIEPGQLAEGRSE